MVVALGEVSTVADRRRQANVDGGRAIRREVTITEAENHALVQAAEAAGMSVPRFLIESALTLSSGESVTERRESITALLGFQGQLAAIGNNLNQLARTANATGEIGRELTHSLAFLHRSLSAVTEAAETVSEEYRRHTRKLEGGRR